MDSMTDQEVKKYILDNLKTKSLNVYTIVSATKRSVNEVNAILRDLQKSHKIVPNPISYRLV